MARLVIRLSAIRHNAALIAGICAERGLGLTAVTKGVLGNPFIVREIVAAGVTSLGDSRLDNIRRMRKAGIKAEYHLIRMPAPEEANEVLRLADVSYHTEIETVKVLAGAAAARGVAHRVVLMVDVGDRREGFMPEDMFGAAEEVMHLHGASLHGVGMNVGCVSGVQPTPVNMGLLAELAAGIEAKLGRRVALVSGGSSLAIPLLLGGLVPEGINHARVGAAILTGDYDTWSEPVPGARHDAFELAAPVIEVKWKPSLPAGELGRDAFGRRPVFEDRGPMLRAICALGRQDTFIEGIEPLDPGLRVVAASSDHVVLDATAADPPPRVGQQVRFRLLYGALLYAMQCPLVVKVYSP